MRQLADMPTLEIVDMSMVEIAEEMPEPEAENKSKPVYQEWGFWFLLIASIVLSFASGALIRSGISVFG